MKKNKNSGMPTVLLFDFNSKVSTKCIYLDYHSFYNSPPTWDTADSCLLTPGNILLKKVVSDAAFPWFLSLCLKSKVSTDCFQRFWWWKNPTFWLDKRHIWPHETTSGSPICYLPFAIISKKSKVVIDSFPKYWWSKNLESDWSHPTKMVISDGTFL